MADNKEVISEKLLHFPNTDPPSSQPKEDQQNEINRHIDEYLQGGGEISQHDSAEYRKFSASLTHKQMLDAKKRSFIFGSFKRLIKG